MADKTILHSDLNCFYASVEVMLDPSLRGKPIAVCGSAEDRHGIVLAKSEPAKRAGVKTGMVNWEARQLCPGLIVVPPQYDQYLKYSKLTRSIYERYTDLVEPYGMDECWLDITGSQQLCGDGRQAAERIRREVKEELGLTVSIGVSFNKIFAKLGSDMKKPDAVTEITQKNFREKVWPLPASNLLYVGRATEKKLKKYAIHTIGDIAATDPEFLRRLLGVNGLALWRYAAGMDTSRVMHRDFVSPVKSVGHGITCVADLENDEEVWKVIFELSQDVGHRLRVHDLSASGVQVYIRGNDLFGSQFQCKLPVKTQLPTEIASAAFHLFQTRYNRQTKVRAICVRAIDLVPKCQPDQLTLFDDPQKRITRENLQDAVEDIRGRFGKRAITYASLLGDLKMPDDGRDTVRMPAMMYQ
ncbi:MAG: DNA polymerase IV [Clostridiales bacterium]|nr:DNA polymerase IV [Clostridiales bacterium]